jgi:hypothetical protein
VETYNPDKEIDAAAWLSLDEDERIELVRNFICSQSKMFLKIKYLYTQLSTS